MMQVNWSLDDMHVFELVSLFKIQLFLDSEIKSLSGSLPLRALEGNSENVLQLSHSS